MTRLLIVEDDPVQAKALARALSQMRPDFTVWTSGNGVEATRLMSERGVDVVLTDLQMPEMDGFELLAWILTNNPELSVFAMSAYGTEDTARRLNGLGLGAIESFTKPVDAQAVLGRVTDALSQSVHGHVRNVSLASFVQLLEMERKSCSLTVRCDDQTGLLVVHKGSLIDARVGTTHGDAAAIAIIAWPNPSIVISRSAASGPPTIQKPLGFIVMEAMRVQDEALRDSTQQCDGTGSVWPAAGRSWRPGAAAESNLPGRLARANEMLLPSGARALAIIDTATGSILHSAARDGCPVAELARMAAQVLRHEMTTLSLCDTEEGIEELVLSTTTRCDVIRPLDPGAREFALLVFAPEDTNLVMARLELSRFIEIQRTP